MSKYTLNLADGTSKFYARKDTAVSHGEKSGKPFQVVTPSGQIQRFNETPTEAPAPEETTTEENTVTETATEQPVADEAKPTPAPKGSPVPISHGSKAQAAGFGGAGVALAESQGLTATVALGEKTVYVSGNKNEVKRFQKAADTLWAAQAEAFKNWKKENKDARKVQFSTPDGQRQMLKDEVAFLENFGAEYVAGQDVL